MGSDQTRETLRKVFEVSLGLIIVICLWEFGGHKDAERLFEDVTIGLLTTIATASILEPSEQRKILRGIEASMKDIKSGINSVHGQFADQIDRYTLALRFTNKNLDRDEMPNAWERMLWSMRGNFDATSFVQPSDYNRSYPDLGVAIQEAKVRVAKSRIRRIFIVESEQELKLISPHIKKQVDAGVEASYLLYSEVSARITESNYDTLDFGLFDDSKSVFLWLLDKRVVAGGKIELETEKYSKYRSLFDSLCRISHPYREIASQGFAA